MAGAKRRRAEFEPATTSDDGGQGGDETPSYSQQEASNPTPTIALPTLPAKRRRVETTTTTTTTQVHQRQNSRQNPNIPSPRGVDFLSPLSDELLLRILSFLPLHQLLAVSPVSRRFYRLSADSQLWKALYYARFVLPRAMRIPGFRDGASIGNNNTSSSSSNGGHKLHYSGRRTLWADGRRGEVKEEEETHSVNWKRQYKIRHNWARGKCAVEELKLSGGEEAGDGAGKMLVKVAEGIAVTADRIKGLRAWDLKSRSLLAQITVVGDQESAAAPSCIAVDETELEREALDVALGFEDGSFGVWRLFTNKKRLEQRYRHEKSSNGELIAMAFSYPYLLTATQAVLVSLYTFDVPSAKETGQKEPDEEGRRQTPRLSNSREETAKLPSPYLLTSLDSRTSRPPLALSIRRAGKTAIASVAYTISTRRGWSIGIQDLHIRQATDSTTATPEIAATRIAYTTPVESGSSPRSPPPPTSPATPRRRNRLATSSSSSSSSAPEAGPSTEPEPEPGPTTLCYTHPYLLATLPDNTLVLHMCTSNASSLSLSDGIRLWGHTSGISDAEITARGKAVSVSTRGEEMRVWELEGGRSSGVGGRSVEIRPWTQSPGSTGSTVGGGGDDDDDDDDWDERRNWVGFDDEMVIVLKERKGTRESLMVYDFT
ncbi:uncharacterized protein B0T15DRAFT_386935 [Chaetomium strumarium]|uniref:F-box domain-containing protein n=1 Tax=Chaetomium strumarium TaxID=1170767 RepID=A0AAJ0H4U2_9PEZI|nr:hypothetical protein B0T15DRAFT_386935 [Chaetomium strumarium]